jgi:two-component system, NtrC family, response regulator AtoC
MSYRVLIVDDDDLSRLRMERALVGGGFATCAATAGREAFDRIVNEDVDLVITERLLPEMDGLRLVWQIKAEFPSVPVVVMTAVGSTRSAIEAMRLGAQDYLVKPVDPAALLRVARRAIEAPVRAHTGRRGGQA